MPEVVILIPHRDHSDYRDFWNFWWRNMEKPPDTGYLEGRGYDLVTQRNNLATRAFETDAEWFFWLDDDMSGPTNALTALLAHAKMLKIPVISGIYLTKKSHGQRGLSALQKVQTAGKTPWDKQNYGYMPLPLEGQPGRFVSVDVIGLGCCLMHRSVFEKMKRPWFEWGDPTSGPSEDFLFFEKMWRELQIKPVVDMECQFEHFGMFRMNVKGEFNPL